MSSYRIAQVSLNGHTVTKAADRVPALQERFCSKCGEKTIMECLSCSSPIRGQYETEGVLVLGSLFQAPAFCHACGEPFPWTKKRVWAAVELVKEGDVSGHELTQFERDVENLTKDSPETSVASIRFNRVMAKVGTSIAAGVKEVLIDVVSEAAKKAIWGL